MAQSSLISVNVLFCNEINVLYCISKEWSQAAGEWTDERINEGTPSAIEVCQGYHYQKIPSFWNPRFWNSTEKKMIFGKKIH